MIRYHTILPPPDLRSLIRFYWTLESDGPYTHRSLACGSVEMVFHYAGVFDELDKQDLATATPITGLQGPAHRYRRYTTGAGFGIFGVYMYPFAIPVLFDMPASALSDEIPDLPSLLGASGRQLEETIMLAKNNQERIGILNSFFRMHLRELPAADQPIASCIIALQEQPQLLPVSEWASHAFLSQRQFERRFKSLAGFSPKLFSRISRFQQATQQYNKDSLSLTALAQHCGYYDQSHFIHDFREFSGFHPREFFKGNAEGTAWRD